MIRGVIGTAGHIDHGKTALVRALTGADTDRLPEEKRRGISIDLGFTHLTIDGRTFGIVDVPGHEDFIRNMLAGTTGVDLLLLVVAADEGVMPQTREHLAIADLLEIPTAVVALTKADLVEEEWLELAREDVREVLRATRFADAPILATSATSGEGLEALRGAIVEHADSGRGDADDLFRLPVDRAFSVHGTGTVVTGTVWSGALQREAGVRLLPGDVTARVRGLQVHGEDVDRVLADQRAAVALGGVDLAEVRRGMTLVADPGWEASSRLTVRLRVLPDAGWTVEDRQRVRVHLGTGEAMARVVLGGGRRLDPGESAVARLRLETPLVARALDRVVLRSYSPVTTIAGGVVLEPVAPARRPRASEEERFRAIAGAEPSSAVAAVLRERGGGGVACDALPIVTGLPPAAVARGLESAGAVLVRDRCYDPDTVAGLRRRLLEALAAYHERFPLRPGMDPSELRRSAAEVERRGAEPALVEDVLGGLLDSGAAVSRDGRVALPGHEPTPSEAQAGVRDRIADALRAAGLTLKPLAEIRAAVDEDPDAEDLLALLCAAGTVLKIDHDLYADAEAVRGLARDLQQRLGGKDGLSPGDFRDVAGVSRKSLIPLLEYFDRVGVTVRTGAGRRIERP